MYSRRDSNASEQQLSLHVPVAAGEADLTIWKVLGALGFGARELTCDKEYFTRATGREAS